MIKCEYFKIQELVSSGTYADRGESAWQLMDPNLLIVLDLLRAKWGPLTVNNWHVGGSRQWSGLRTPESSFYSKYSQHSYGRAADIICPHVDAMRADIIANPADYPLIGGIELDVPWLHIDTRNSKELLKFSK